MARRGSVWRAAEWPSKPVYKKEALLFSERFFDKKLKFKIHWQEFHSIRFKQFRAFNVVLWLNKFVSWSQTCCGYSIPILLLIELQESSDLKLSFRDLPLDKFYSSVPTLTIPALQHKHASRMASLFGSTYICERTFSVMNFNKSKWRTALTDENFQFIL